MSYVKEDLTLLKKHYNRNDVRTWPYYPIEMPSTKDGQGPATVGVDADKIEYEVWDHLCNSNGSYEYLPDAINEAMRLTNELLED